VKFKYWRLKADPVPAFPSRTHQFRPIIPVRLHYGSVSENYLALIDSGADYSIFHAEIGELLGIDVRSGKALEFRGTGDTPQIAYFHDIHLEIGGHKNDLYAGFSYDIKNVPTGILGQVGFFDVYEVRFDYEKGSIELKPRRGGASI